MAKLTILLSIIHILPLSLVFLLPDTRQEQRDLRNKREESTLAGVTLLLTIVSSIVFVIVVDVFLVYSR
jgi:hypothetical protein